MAKENVYLTMLCNDEYLVYTFGLYHRWKKLNHKYPFKVFIPEKFVGDKLSLSTLDYLRKVIGEENVIIRATPEYFEKLYTSGLGIWQFAICKLAILSFREFNKICWLDGDLFINKNLDYLFEYQTPLASHCRVFTNQLQGGLFIFDPADEYDIELVKHPRLYLNGDGKDHDQKILGKLFRDINWVEGIQYLHAPWNPGQWNDEPVLHGYRYKGAPFSNSIPKEDFWKDVKTMTVIDKYVFYNYFDYLAKVADLYKLKEITPKCKYRDMNHLVNCKQILQYEM